MRRSSIYVVPVHLLYRWRLTCKLHLVFWRRIYLVDAVLCTLAFRLRCTRTLVLYTTPYLVVWLLDVDIFALASFDRLWWDPAFTLCQCISSKGEGSPGIFILFSEDGCICLTVHCVLLLCDVGISCAYRLTYPKWADLSSFLFAFYYNLHIFRISLSPVCLPFAFAFQLSQHQSALRNCRAIVFEKGSKKKGGCVKVEEEARVSGEL